MYKNFIKPYWKLFKRLLNPYMGLVSNNITRSLSFYVVKSLDSLLSEPRGWVPSTDLPTIHTYSALPYTTPITTVSLAFQKTLYNTLMIYMLYFLTYCNTSTRSYFQLNHGFLILPSNINLYMFCNCFYFKIKNY